MRITPGRVAVVLGAVAVAMVALGAAGQIAEHVFGHGHLLGFVPIFYLGSDDSVPTWTSSITLLFCAALLAQIALMQGRRGGRDRLAWWILAAFFLAFSIDEVARIHEVVGEYGGKAVLRGMGLKGKFFSYTWIVIGIPFALACGAAFSRFFLRLPGGPRRLIGCAAALYIGGALGFEALGGWYFKRHGSDLNMEVLVLLEEAMEMAGAVVFAYGLAEYIRTELGGAKITIHID